MKKMGMDNDIGSVWIFGDFRDYFKNRVTLQLIAKGKELANALNTGVTVVLIGEQVHQYAMEYIAHGADAVMVADSPQFKEYQVERYTAVLSGWVEYFKPEIFLAGATSFGREFFPRLAKRLHAGLSADCIALEVEEESRLLVQTTPAWGGVLLAEVVAENNRPQMATVHPGVFKELPHNPDSMGCIIYPEIGDMPEERIEVIGKKRRPKGKINLEDARVIFVGGMGVGSRDQFEMLFELAELMEGEVGATRPVVREGWADEDRLLGQTGKTVKPKLLITIGTSGALQYTTGIQGSETIIAINRDPNAPIFKMADLGLVGDASKFLPMLVAEIRKRLQEG
jgi:electron transfer flavoprotein alpha subunit